MRASIELEPVRDSVRRHPTAWALGGVLAGLMATRALGGTLARGGRHLATTWVSRRFGDAILSAGLRALDAIHTHVDAALTPAPRAPVEPSEDGVAHTAARAAPTTSGSDGATGRVPDTATPRSAGRAPAARKASEPQDPQALSGS